MNSRVRRWGAALATAWICAIPATSHAAITWSAEATREPATGNRLLVDVTIRNDAPVQGLAVSVHDYDTSLLRLDVSGSILSQNVLVEFPVGPGFGFGGLDGNTVTLPLVETVDAGVGRVRFFEGRQLQGAEQTGELDISPITGAVGGPQFRLVFDIVGTGLASLTVSSNAVGDAVIFPGPIVSTSNSVTLAVPVPEPGTGLLVLLGFASLAQTRSSGRARLDFASSSIRFAQRLHDSCQPRHAGLEGDHSASHLERDVHARGVHAELLDQHVGQA